MNFVSVPKTRRYPCWIEGFIEATEGLPTPELFRKWVAISVVAGALERRVWAESSMSRVYPNLYILLVAPPGVGKSEAIKVGSHLSASTKRLKIAPDDVTKASLIDNLALAYQTKVYSATEMIEYHSLQIFADEFGVLIPSHDISFMSVMNKLFDNAAQYHESRRGRDDDLMINNPQVNLLAGTQPNFLAGLLPPEAWGMGFMSRMLMVYHGQSVRVPLFTKRKRLDTSFLLVDLKEVCELHGEMEWAPEAQDLLVSWYDSGMEPVPEHTKLKHYVPRRILNMMKLCIVSAVSRGSDMTILDSDVARARDWLLEIESLMPDVFKDMGGQNDALVIQDLHYYCWQQYTKNENKPIHRSRIETFLYSRTPPYNIEFIVKTCIRAKILLQQPDQDFFIPGNKASLNSE